MKNAEAAVLKWVMEELMARLNRAALYRSLGRGWLFVHLLRPKKQFRFWFESVQRVLRNHRDVIDYLKLDAPAEAGEITLLEKYTRGYVMEAEAVCLMNGIVPKAFSPLISINRIAPDYRHRDHWGLEVQEYVDAPNPTDEGRLEQAQSARMAEKARLKRAKARARKKEKKLAAAFSKEACEQDAIMFEQLLSELKLEAAEAEEM